MNVDLALKTTTASSWDRVLTTEHPTTLDTRFADLVHRQSRFVFRLAYAVLRNSTDAEDIVQETFLKLFKNQSWQHIENERAFLARTAWRIAITRKPKPSQALRDERAATTTPETTALDTERTRQMQTLIDSLPGKLRQPLILSAVDDLTTSEIAAALDQPEGTIRRRLSEARTLLKNKWERMQDAR